MLPLSFLTLVLTITLAAFLSHLAARRRVSHQLRHAAMEWRMHYSETDRFELTPRVAERFPVAGASDFAVYDLLYRQDQSHHRYLFTVEYTRGVIRAKNRVRRIASLSEPRDPHGPEGWSPLILAPAALPLVEQYRVLREA